jgi:ABC-type branched-subunit amino acid transport system substrate-binding protein
MRARWLVAFAVVVTVLATACSNSSSGGTKGATTGSTETAPSTAKPGTFPHVDQPGVTDTEVRVAGVASVTNPTGVPYGDAFNGVRAYFDMVNAAGGVYGRKLVLAQTHDDQLSNDKRVVEGMLDQDQPFAALPISVVLFTGADLLARSGVPTFGWNIQQEWTGPPNFFGQVGALCFGSQCANPSLPWLVSKLHKKRVGVLAYSVEQSATCLDMIKGSFDKFPTAKVVFTDKSLSFGVTDFSADVKKMVDAKVDFVTTCMDKNGVLGLAREMRQQGLNAAQYLPNAYDQEFMQKNAGFFEGAYVLAQEAPIETTPKFAALRDYISWMDKDGFRKTENAEIGWVNAAQFVNGLKGAGQDFTRQKLVDAINRETAFNADGMIVPIDWTKQHTETQPPLACGALVKVVNGKFQVAFSPAGKPFICLDRHPADAAKEQPTYLR